ncbi:MAG TPA: hypothetical protein VGL57_15090 [Solirubrobacteraceae bacterium]|jgi:hypothetical protein
MALIPKKTPEQKAIEAGIKEQDRETRERQQAQAAAEKVTRERAERREKIRQAFFATPAGRARLAFESGDELLQFSIDVMNQKAIVVAMVGANTSKKTTDPSAVLNSVNNEGWELVTGSFVFVEEGQESRDKFASSGQNVATKGATVGYYLFRRSEANRRETTDPWEQDLTEQ